MKTTPGPWKQSKRAGHARDGDRIVITDGGLGRVAVVSRNGVPDAETAQANADIITAAPELKDALEIFMEASLGLPDMGGCYPEIRDAYDKGRELLDRLNRITADDTKE